ncbi:MAG: hypothetical protein WC026_13110 [Hyphomicrobium sp.]|uniref:hypothetical protein n=1 Tax=Hyphomicrobium sp. TaxID=82 RepID=UPI0035627964
MENEELQKLTKYEISNEEIQNLFPKVNDGSRWYVDTNTFEFVDAIIEQWFEEKGVTFWEMPEIEQYELVGEPTKIIFYCT